MAMDPETEPTSVVRAQDLWFEDGGIVVKAQKTLFRVSRAILVLQSPIFADMFKIPQPPNAEAIDGCPVVELFDSAEDVSVFFKAIFDSSFFEPYPAPTTFGIITGVLRLSTKYEVDYLRRRAVVHLCSMFPTTLVDWDLRQTLRHRSDTPLWKVPSWQFSAEIPDVVALISLARQARVSWILPCVFYDLAVGDWDSSLALSLSNDEQEVFINGYLLQRDAGWLTIQFLSDHAAMQMCTAPATCSRVKSAALLNAECVDFPAMPLTIWEEGDWEYVAEVCANCLVCLRHAHQKARQDFWDRLPSLYGLRTWQELLAEKVLEGY
ncbi:hypothetical protein C8R46DRAFT_945816 [Mycena filopes]|nr:hypothetical protein C8R46DRAFT_945816 [Mycena filopes]